jgi:succinyl-diaminopimelate desuccinylase
MSAAGASADITHMHDAQNSQEQESLAALLLWLCSVHSPIGEEGPLCDAVVARLARTTLAAPIRRYGNSIVVPLTRGTGGHHIALVGHLDTVRTENGPARIDGDRCFGAGASDMKSGLALMLNLADAAAAAPCDLTLVFYAKEEGPFAENELGPVLDADAELRSVDLAVCLEPSDNKLHLGCCGSLHAELTFVGRSGHSARPWEADNAIYRAAAFLCELSALAPEETTIDGMIYRSVYTATQAKDGGRGRNVVPDSFVVNLNHRFAPRYSVVDAQRHVERLVAGRASIRFIDLSPAAPPMASHPLVQSLVAAGVAGIAPKQAWTDVARFATLGIAAINFGPGENAQAHQKNESTSLRLLHEGAVILRRWLATLPPKALTRST